MEYLTFTYSPDDEFHGMNEVTRINQKNIRIVTAIRFLRVVAYTADLENDGKTISATLPIQFASNKLDSKISLSLGKPLDQFEELRLQGKVGVPIYFTTASNQLNHPFTPARLLQLELTMEMDECIVYLGITKCEMRKVTLIVGEMLVNLQIISRILMNYWME
jgi:hypothetical protein